MKRARRSNSPLCFPSLSSGDSLCPFLSNILSSLISFSLPSLPAMAFSLSLHLHFFPQNLIREGTEDIPFVGCVQRRKNQSIGLSPLIDLRRHPVSPSAFCFAGDIQLKGRILLRQCLVSLASTASASLLQTDSNSILHAAMSLFDAIPSGRILSRGRERKGSQNEVSEFGKSETALSMVVGFLLVMSTNGASAFLYPVVDDENDGVTQI
ncbi:uncharacterized protein LOC116266186 isoform X2 [Nymphaea colorata]|uniref:uncharacterized protein LOC116266186 isoform X2 n=1 Tax=Nymphaea colorata TaxID=210225 RepID=UPI00214E63E0|nr:uncharacterized protein LOC116266186 isoform X2 [Nymphaea colorata]